MSKSQQICESVEEMWIDQDTLSKMNNIIKEYKEKQRKFINMEQIYSDCDEKIMALRQAVAILEEIERIKDL